MKILLDIDGVMVTTPSWRKAEFEEDGFLKFNENSTRNLAYIISQTNAGIILSSTHRITYSLLEWKIILNKRGIFPSSISKINLIDEIEYMSDRATEINDWIEKNSNENFVVIDDDLSINRLSKEIKQKCVLTSSLIGLDAEATNEVLNILNNYDSH